VKNFKKKQESVGSTPLFEFSECLKTGKQKLIINKNRSNL